MLSKIDEKVKTPEMKTHWPTKKLGEVLEYEQPTKYLVSLTDYEDRYPVPVLTAGKSFILGHTNEKMGIFPKKKLPVIIFDDFTTAIKFVDFPFKVKSSAMKILHAKMEKADIKFLFYLMKTIKFKAGQHKRYWISEYSKIDIPLPPLFEQKRIVERIEKIFAKIDEAQKLRESALADSAALVPSALHQVFKRAKKEGWPTRRLGEIIKLKPKKSEVKDLSDDTEVSFIPMAAIDESTQSIRNSEARKIESVRRGYTYFRDGDVLFAKITPCMENGKVAIACNLKNGIGFGSTEFHVLRPTNQVLSEWIFYLVSNPDFRREAKKYMTGTAGQQRVPLEFLESTTIPLPSIIEQKKITAHLDAVSEKARRLQELQKSQLADFSALRQSVLHLAFQGELVK